MSVAHARSCFAFEGQRLFLRYAFSLNCTRKFPLLAKCPPYLLNPFGVQTSWFKRSTDRPPPENLRQLFPTIVHTPFQSESNEALGVAYSHAWLLAALALDEKSE